MKKLIIRGNLGIHRGAELKVDGEEVVCFAIDKQGDYHGPSRPQLWCTVGTEDERETLRSDNTSHTFLMSLLLMQKRLLYFLNQTHDTSRRNL